MPDDRHVSRETSARDPWQGMAREPSAWAATRPPLHRTHVSVPRAHRNAAPWNAQWNAARFLEVRVEESHHMPPGQFTPNNRTQYRRAVTGRVSRNAPRRRSRTVYHRSCRGFSLFRFLRSLFRTIRRNM